MKSSLVRQKTPLSGARRHAATSLFTGLVGVSPSDLLIPGGMESPCPRFTYGPAGHCLEGAWLADRAQVDMDEDAAQHDEGGECRAGRN